MEPGKTMSVRNVSLRDVVDEGVARAERQAVRAVVDRAVVVADRQAAHRAVDVVELRPGIVDRPVVARRCARSAVVPSKRKPLTVTAAVAKSAFL